MISKYSHKTLNWIDLEAPKTEEIEHVTELYSISGAIKNKLIFRQNDDMLEMEYDHIYASIGNTITILATDNYVVTLHEDKIPGLDKFKRELELDIVTGEKINSNRLLFAYLLKNIFSGQNNQLKDFEAKLVILLDKTEKEHKKYKELIIIIILLTILLITSLCL
jgi:Mg2+ and Co2+ transporter CorA